METMRKWLGLALLGFTLAACATVEEPLAEPLATQGLEGSLLVFAETLELEAPVGESVETSFFYLNASGTEDLVRATSFATVGFNGPSSLAWIEFLSGNVETVAPFGFVEVRLRATCNEAALEAYESLARPDDELFSNVRVQGKLYIDTVGVRLKCF